MPNSYSDVYDRLMPSQEHELLADMFRLRPELAVDVLKALDFQIPAQLRADKRKRFAWPAYVGTLYARVKCPLLLLVVCLDATVADWCGKPVVITDPRFFRTRGASEAGGRRRGDPQDQNGHRRAVL
jgi:hypothetical protein